MKPFCDHRELVHRMSDLGMVIDDEIDAEQYLRKVGYHRLGGYRYVFRQMLAPTDRDPEHRRWRRDEFAPGTSLAAVRELEEWDAELRQLCEAATSDLEIRLRTAIAHVLARRDPYDDFTAATNLDFRACSKRTRNGSTSLAEWRKTVDKSIRQAEHEDFVVHHRHRYPNAPLPVWALVDLLSLGSLPYLIDLLKTEDSNEVAHRFGLKDGRVLASWSRVIADLRNVCAHHSRLFNRSMKRPVSVRPSAVAQPVLLQHLMRSGSAAPRGQTDQRRLYPALAVLAYMLTTHESGSEWPPLLAQHARTFPEHDFGGLDMPPVRLEASCGFPAAWQDLALWKQ